MLSRCLPVGAAVSSFQHDVDVKEKAELSACAADFIYFIFHSEKQNTRVAYWEPNDCHVSSRW